MTLITKTKKKKKKKDSGDGAGQVSVLNVEIIWVTA